MILHTLCEQKKVSLPVEKGFLQLSPYLPISNVVLVLDPDTVGENQDQISDLISTMTGGDCEIQDIQPFTGDGPDSFQQLDFEALTWNPKTVTSERRSR